MSLSLPLAFYFSYTNDGSDIEFCQFVWNIMCHINLRETKENKTKSSCLSAAVTVRKSETFTSNGHLISFLQTSSLYLYDFVISLI